jgi:transcriptional regulator with XRE-family HTH domain
MSGQSKGLLNMAITEKKLNPPGDIAELRKAAGLWLRGKRETAGLSQRELAIKVGFEYYTFISQIESGRGRVPAERYEKYAKAFQMSARDFAMTMLRFNDPHTYRMIFEGTDQTNSVSEVNRLEERLRLIEAKLSD